MFEHTYLAIHLNNIAANYRHLAAQAPHALTGAVVKANGYGLGVGPVAKCLEQAGAIHFFVANLDEAIELRGHLPKPAIYVFHGVSKGEEKAFLEHRITPVLNSQEQIQCWLAQKQTFPFVLHIDTGMNRLGVDWEETTLKNIQPEFIMSHLACADEPEHPLNQKQLEKMLGLRKRYPHLPISLCNSSGIFLGTDYHFDITRPGCALYGIRPQKHIQMKPVARLTSTILQIRTLQKSEPVGYGATQTIKKGSRLATIPVGYADGWLRSLSHHGEVSVAGKIVPMVGRVSMDLIVVDVTSIPEAIPGTKVELMGEHLSVDRVAEKAGTIGYEILTRLGDRFKRIYE